VLHRLDVSVLPHGSRCLAAGLSKRLVLVKHLAESVVHLSVRKRDHVIDAPLTRRGHFEAEQPDDPLALGKLEVDDHVSALGIKPREADPCTRNAIYGRQVIWNLGHHAAPFGT
jgi:hypothetical protein